MDGGTGEPVTSARPDEHGAIRSGQAASEDASALADDNSSSRPATDAPTRSESELSRWTRVDDLLGRRWMGALLMLSAVVLPLLRQRGTPSWQTVWAEDGSIYTQQPIWHGVWRTIGLGYNGYIQVPTRVLAMPTTLMPVRDIAVYLAVVSALLGAAMAFSVFHLSRGWVASRTVRVVLASFVVLMPALGKEVTASITQSIWMILAALAWALVSLDERPRDQWLRGTLAFLGATCSSMALLFLPLGIGWVLYRRTRAACIVLGVFAVGLVVQLAGTAVSSPQVRYLVPTRHMATLLQGLSTRVFGVYLLGTSWEADLWHIAWVAVVVIAPVLVVSALVVVGREAPRPARVLAGAFVASAIAFFVVPTWERGTNVLGLVPGGADTLGDTRYSVVPIMLLASAFAVLVSPCAGGRAAVSSRRGERVGRPAFVVQALIVMVASFSVWTLRSGEAPWIQRVDRTYASQCAGRPANTVVLVPNDTEKVSVYFPVPATGYFPMRVHCSDLK
jgi:hypothetical protein